MNAHAPTACTCNPCRGAACTCGCQAPTPPASVTACTCGCRDGQPCRCGSSCA